MRLVLLRGSLGFGVCVFAVLAAVAGRYGYHRDELYFLEAGRHLAWGYPDQPPFMPLLARVMNDLASGSLVVLRLPSAVVAAALVPLTAVMSRLLGGERGAQLLAAGSVAVSAVLLGAGHVLSTTTFDLLAWAVISLLVVVYPVLLAAGAQPALGWTRRGHRRLRRVALAAAFVLSAISSLYSGLTLVPLRTLHKTSVVALNYDIGETVAWPTYLHEIAADCNGLPSSVRAHGAILTSNYGEAGAVDRYGPALGLPAAYSGHMGFWYS
jgi:hypothetical protein